ncbi:MAG: hypothetical protein ACYDDF_13550 [Thermoplasmatota archaeon]
MRMRSLLVVLLAVGSILAVSAPAWAGSPKDPEASNPKGSAKVDANGLDDLLAVWTTYAPANGSLVLGFQVQSWNATNSEATPNPFGFELDFTVGATPFRTVTQEGPAGLTTLVAKGPPTSPVVNTTPTPPNPSSPTPSGNLSVGPSGTSITPAVTYGAPATILISLPKSDVPIAIGDSVQLTSLFVFSGQDNGPNAPNVVDSAHATRAYVVGSDLPAPPKAQTTGNKTSTGSGSTTSSPAKGPSNSTVGTKTTVNASATPNPAGNLSQASVGASGSSSSSAPSSSGKFLGVPAVGTLGTVALGLLAFVVRRKR